MPQDWLLYVLLSLCGVGFAYATYRKRKADRAAYWYDVEADAYGPEEAWRRYVEGRQGEKPGEATK